MITRLADEYYFSFSSFPLWFSTRMSVPTDASDDVIVTMYNTHTVQYYYFYSSKIRLLFKTYTEQRPRCTVRRFQRIFVPTDWDSDSSPVYGRGRKRIARVIKNGEKKKTEKIHGKRTKNEDAFFFLSVL